MLKTWNRLMTAAAVTALMAGVSAANDGFAGITATGLEFGKTDKIAMQSEDLYIGMHEIRVAYVFKNTSAEDVTGTVAFPMPPFAVSTFLFTPTQFKPADLDAENPMDFTATVDGKKVAVKTERRAYLVSYDVPEGTTDDGPVNPPASKEYDEPGEDVTDLLTGLGIPLAFDAETVMKVLDTLPADKIAELKKRGLLDKDETGENGPEMRWIIGWSIGIRHYWEQTFPAGAEIRIEHAYKSFPNGGLFYWYDWTKPTPDWDTDPNADDRKKYCIDAGTAEAIKAALPEDPEANNSRGGTAYNIAYVLTTANTWKGPIGTFKLTLDKGSPKNVLSLCMDGVKKTSDTQFTVEKKNFTPDRDLEILIVTRDPAFKE